uniref:Uncharacterized protein n=1 Tax=Eutreptiella gymnastica TaxID=73025 RepID=A0A7S1ILQ3_9EUGL
MPSVWRQLQEFFDSVETKCIQSYRESSLGGSDVLSPGRSGFAPAIEKEFTKTIPKRRGTWPESNVTVNSGKPVMVILTRSECSASERLKSEINDGRVVSSKLRQFEVVHLEDNKGDAWQEDGHSYAPQVYFFSSKGEPLSVEGPMRKFTHLFATEKELGDAMEEAFALNKVTQFTASLDSISPEDVPKLSMQELKERLLHKGVSYKSAVEKKDLVELLLETM